DVAAGRITLGDLVAFNGYLAYLAWPTVALGLTLSVVRRGLTSMERIQEIVEAAPPAAGEGTPLAGAPSLAFEHLTWGYPGRGPALRDVTFSVAPGEIVAVVGPTGAGKTTLGLLLARLWDPPPGTVFVGGRDVTTLPLATLRATIGWVPQEAFLFSRSIEDNITLGRAGLDVAAAARAAAVDGEVSGFPDGYATVVGERGLTVSGGQRQRLALARALAGRPPILVLDDVFASVDAATEAAIVRALRDHRLTTLVLAHRLGVAQAGDRAGRAGAALSPQGRDRRSHPGGRLARALADGGGIRGDAGHSLCAAQPRGLSHGAGGPARDARPARGALRTPAASGGRLLRPQSGGPLDDPCAQ